VHVEGSARPDDRDLRVRFRTAIFDWQPLVRYKRARDAAGLRPLRWHDLRHTFGSLPVAGGVDLVSVRDAMGHTQLTTTSRCLHARPAAERAASFTAAFQSGSRNATDE
jgi:integrase